MFPGIMSG